MNWTLVAPEGADVDAATAEVTVDRVLRWGAPQAGLDLADVDTGVVVAGPDHLLASVARRLHAAGRRGPVLFAGGEESDLLRMFAVASMSLGIRARDGGPYPCDLGTCHVGGREIPFVSHVVARSRTGLRAHDVTVSRGSRTATVRGWQVVVANAQHLAGATIAPKSAVMDGLLDVQVLGGPLRGRAALRRALRRGLHLTSREVWRRQAGEASLEVPPGWRVAADGRPVGAGSFTIKTTRGAFDLWI